MGFWPEKHEENGWLDREEDSEDYQRAWWQVTECPKKCECSKASWDRVKCWSYESSDKALNYVMKHLTESSLHNMTEEDAAAVLFEVVPEQYTETYKDRDHYRRQVDKTTANSKPRPPSTSPPRGHMIRTRSRSRHSTRGRSPRKGTHMILDKLGNTVRRIPEDIADLKSDRRSPVRSSGARPSGSEQCIFDVRSSSMAPRKIDMDSMVRVKNSLERASQSCQRGHQFAQAMANQFKAEEDVIRGAYDAVDALLTQYVKRSGGL